MRIVLDYIGKINRIGAAVRNVLILHSALVESGAGLVSHRMNDTEKRVGESHTGKALRVVHLSA